MPWSTSTTFPGALGSSEQLQQNLARIRRDQGTWPCRCKPHAEDLAVRHGVAELWAQHSDRIAREPRLSAQAVQTEFARPTLRLEGPGWIKMARLPDGRIEPK